MSNSLIKKVGPFILLVSLIVVACKKPEVTNSPLKSTADMPDGPVVLVNEGETVGLEEVPKLTVAIDVSNCMGLSKWEDSSKGDLQNRGAVSVAPSFKDAAESTQPEARVFEPLMPSDASDSTSRAKIQYVWRIKKAAYVLEALAYNVYDSKEQSNISKNFDFSVSNEVLLKIQGTWQSATKTCKLDWK